MDYYSEIARILERWGWVRDQSTYFGYEIWRHYNRPPLSVRRQVATAEAAMAILARAGLRFAIPPEW
jgi:hypothetical protein